MAYRQILPITHPLLTQPSEAVDLTNGVPAEIKTLARDLLETSRAADGAGMAAVQVGIPVRVFLMDLYRIGGDTIVFINPTVEFKSAEVQKRKEGCLSMPGVFFEVERPESATISYFDLDGKAKSYTASGHAAICALHELDHLDGIRHIDRLSPLKRERALKRFGVLRRRPPPPTLPVSTMPMMAFQQDTLPR